MGLSNVIRRRRARRNYKRAVQHLEVKPVPNGLVVLGRYPKKRIVVAREERWFPGGGVSIDEGIIRFPFAPEKCPFDHDGSGSCVWHDQSCHRPEANGERLVEITNPQFVLGPIVEAAEPEPEPEPESEATSSDRFIVSVDAARDGGEATILVFRHTADGRMEQVPATIVRERNPFAELREALLAHSTEVWWDNATVDEDTKAEAEARDDYPPRDPYPTTPEEAYLDERLATSNLRCGVEHPTHYDYRCLEEPFHDLPHRAPRKNGDERVHAEQIEWFDPIDDGAVPPQDEVDAVVRAGICDSSAIVGHPVLYQTDERGGKRYVLPARVTVVRKSHPDLALTHAAANAGKVREPGDKDAITIEGKEATVNAGYAIKSKDGYYVADNPVPIPLDGTAHLKVDTPGPKGTYDEWSVPYDPAGAPRTWRFLADPNPF